MQIGLGLVVIGVSDATLVVPRGMAATSTPKFRAQDVDTQVKIGYGLAIADVNGDKRPDIILADQRTVQWYANPNWTKHVIAENLTPQDHVCVAAQDIDGDGKAEIAVGAGWNPGDTVNSGAVFYLIPPSDRTQKWTPVPLHHEPTVHRMHWVTTPGAKWELVVKPLHGKGNKGGEGVGGRVLSYAIPSDPKAAWNTSLVSDFMHMSHNFQPINWDRDPEHELVIGSKEGVWLLGRNTTSAAPNMGWVRQQMTDQPTGEIREGKLPGGKRFLATIEPMHGTTVALYRDPGSSQSLWVRHKLDDSLKDGHGLAVADFLGTGSDQIVAGWRGMTPSGVPGVRMFVPTNADGTEVKVHEISGTEVAIEDLKAADLNGDSKLDLILAGRQTKNLRILWNETTNVNR